MRRLVLFDIDGTLLRSDGAGRRAIRTALLEVYGRAGTIDSHPLGGRTDPQIVREVLAQDDVAIAEVEAGLAAVWEVYLRELARELPAAHVRVLPGVRALLDRVHAHGAEVMLGLLTGNVAEGARLKLTAAGLDFDRFRVGAFGSDHWERARLPEIAVDRARAVTGVGYAGREIVIVGDTPFDIACGAHLGVRTIATATGQHGPEELRACGAEYVFGDLADVDEVWEAITAP